MMPSYPLSVHRRPRNMEVLRPVRVRDAAGGYWMPYETVATVRGHLRPLGAYAQREVQMAGGAAVVLTHRAYLPAGTDLRHEDRLRAGDVTYQVAQVVDPGGMGQRVVAELRQVDPE